MFTQYRAKSTHLLTSNLKLAHFAASMSQNDVRSSASIPISAEQQEGEIIEALLRRNCLCSARRRSESFQSTIPNRFRSYAIVAMMRVADESHTVDFEEGYIRHLEWHRQAKDKFNWYSYSFGSSTDRQRWIIYATFGHTSTELSNPVSPAEDQRDAILNIPHVQYMGSSIYEFLPALSRGNSVPSPLLKAEYTTVEVNFGEAKAFEEALASEQSGLQREMLWYRMVEGGGMSRYIRLRPRASLENILDQRSGQTLPDKVKGLVSKMTVEILNLRPDMLVKVTAEPPRP